MIDLYALAVASLIGAKVPDDAECKVRWVLSEGYRSSCSGPINPKGKWETEEKLYEMYYRTVGGNNNQGHNGKPPIDKPDGNPVCPPPFQPCDDPHDPMYPDHPPTPEVPPVPLPAAVWMLLVAVGMLVGIKVKGDTHDPHH